jgi:hypothetical protein
MTRQSRVARLKLMTMKWFRPPNWIDAIDELKNLVSLWIIGVCYNFDHGTRIVKLGIGFTNEKSS